MPITTFTSREFNQDVSKIKKATSQGPVFITDRGHAAHVLLAIEDYLKLTKTKETIVDLLAMPDSPDIAFEAPKFKGAIFRPEEFD
jgi:PHD/YefM family antitoxin component YafN of YafNO toxin-antitoxin module